MLVKQLSYFCVFIINSKDAFTLLIIGNLQMKWLYFVSGFLKRQPPFGRPLQTANSGLEPHNTRLHLVIENRKYSVEQHTNMQLDKWVTSNTMQNIPSRNS